MITGLIPALFAASRRTGLLPRRSEIVAAAQCRSTPQVSAARHDDFSRSLNRPCLVPSATSRQVPHAFEAGELERRAGLVIKTGPSARMRMVRAAPVRAMNAHHIAMGLLDERALNRATNKSCSDPREAANEIAVRKAPTSTKLQSPPTDHHGKGECRGGVANLVRHQLAASHQNRGGMIAGQPGR